MHKLRALVFGPGRAVSVLSFTEILAWGILIYPPVLIMPHLVADHGWSLAFGMAGFSIGLMTSGMLSPTVGHLIDRHGWQHRDVAGGAGRRAWARAANGSGPAPGLSCVLGC